MSPEERQLLTALFDRIRDASNTPRDADAETLIARAVDAQPYSAYYLAQAVIVQEKGLEAAGDHIRTLEDRIAALEHQLQSAPAQSPQQGGFLGSIFGGNEARQPARSPAPANAGPWGRSPSPPYAGIDPRGGQPQSGGPWSPQPYAAPQGSGFLQGALGTAAGVAGGMLLANSLSGLFSSPTSGLAALTGTPAAGPVEETVVNNYYGDQADDTSAGPIDAADPGSAGNDNDSGFDSGGGDSSDA